MLKQLWSISHKEKLIPNNTKSIRFAKTACLWEGEPDWDWLHVEDHVEALYLCATQGRSNETYNIGGDNELRNIEFVKLICSYLSEL